jgi:hypothetical protein
VIVLLVFLFGATVNLPFSGIQVRKAQAKNDCAQITTAVKAYYAEYGIYPLGSHAAPDELKPIRFIFGQVPTNPSVDSGVSNAELFDILRNIDSTGATPPGTLGKPTRYNPRAIVFFDGMTADDKTHPHSGFVPVGAKAPARPGAFMDPWGTEYFIAISSEPLPRLLVPYKDFQGENAPRINVGVFSLGKDQRLGTKGDGFHKNPSTSAISDDIISWE